MRRSDLHGGARLAPTGEVRDGSGSTEESGAICPQAVAAARANALPEPLLQLTVETFQALADPTRVRILHALIGGPLCVRDLALVAGVSESAVSHQLRLLQARRLVRSRRAGNVKYYAVDDAHVAGFFREAAHHADHVLRGLPDHPIWDSQDSRKDTDMPQATDGDGGATP
jgi:DNA-binding transcriptional ArsR family regulator